MSPQTYQMPKAQDAEARVQLYTYDSVTQWIWGAAVTLSAELGRSLEHKPRARLLLSGGTTPAPVYAALAKSPLDWSAIDVALVDERWLRPDDPDSNARLIRESLLQGNAARARFETLTQPGRPLTEAVATANAHARNAPDVVVLGMGEDGHTASLFPGMRDLDAALSSRQAYVAADATGCPGAGNWHTRISLTPAGLAPARVRVLLIRGQRKRDLLERVLAGEDAHEYPARIAFTTPGAPLHVHWCP
ncbi:6-phosphogluconolactonase [Luteimonas abyssi]|uniref:6-phosphogluconolactonase n=1 Tax=Luteimonas abyssi TaxID=1247514 RepID=UPI000A3DCE03|nr:6-phosphogluconolactonase [Luteimonas abyssi]